MAYLRAGPPRPSKSETEQTEGNLRGYRYCGAGVAREAVMDEKVPSGASGYGNSTEYEWRWWHGVLGLAIMLAIISLTYL